MGFIKSVGVVALGALLSVGAIAADYVEGKDYIRLETPVRTDDPSKIEVAEVFWYGCSHCYKFEPLVTTWKAAAKEDINFVGVPAMWRQPAAFGDKKPNDMELHARAFYTAKALGVLDKVQQPMFEALHSNPRSLSSEAALSALFADIGVDRETFLKTFNSFGVKSQVMQAFARIRGYKVGGTPEMVVDGTYRVSGTTAGSNPEMLKVVDYLVDKIRAEKQ